MADNKNTMFYRLEEKGFKSFNQSPLIQTKQIRGQLSEAELNQVPFPKLVSLDSMLTLIFLFSIAVLALLVGFKLLKDWKFDRDKMIDSIRFYQVPCRNCQFFKKQPLSQVCSQPICCPHSKSP